MCQDYHRHLQLQFADRRAYYRIRELSCRFWGMADWSAGLSSVSIIVDGCDQAKFRVPRNLPAAKSFQDLVRPALHCIGVLAHGFQERYWLSDSDLKKDPATQCEVLSRVIDDILQACHLKASRPRHLHMQGDNCFREQRNQWLLFFGIWLVTLGLFESVSFGFLMKGHTHEDIGTVIQTFKPKS